MYLFHVHRQATRWRLVLRDGDPFPAQTTADQWQRTRSREAEDTNADVRAEVDRRGYCLFAITADFDELDSELARRDTEPEARPSPASGEEILGRAVRSATDVLGHGLSAAYAIGSLAHGGFTPLVSDVDIMLVIDPIDENTEALIAEVQESVRIGGGGELAQRLSIFWSDWHGVRNGIEATGRLPEVDRLDLLESGRLLYGADGRDRAVVPRPGVIVQQAAEFALARFDGRYVSDLQVPARLVSAGPRPVTKAALFPIRFLFTLTTGMIGRNDAAAAWAIREDRHAELARHALRWRDDGIQDALRAAEVLERHLVPVYERFATRYAERLDGIGRPQIANRLRGWAGKLRSEPTQDD